MEKLTEVAKPRSEVAKESARQRLENRDWLHMSQDIALDVHYYLRNAGMTQKELADRMGVSAVYVGKLLKGTENLTLETICKVQKALGEELVSIAKPYITKQIMVFSTKVEFSKEAVYSKKYSEKQNVNNGFVSVIGDAA